MKVCVPEARAAYPRVVQVSATNLHGTQVRTTFIWRCWTDRIPYEPTRPWWIRTAERDGKLS